MVHPASPVAAAMVAAVAAVPAATTPAAAGAVEADAAGTASGGAGAGTTNRSTSLWRRTAILGWRGEGGKSHLRGLLLWGGSMH